MGTKDVYPKKIKNLILNAKTLLRPQLFERAPSKNVSLASENLKQF